MKKRNIKKTEKIYDFGFVFILPLLLTFYENYRNHWYDNILKFILAYLIGIMIFFIVNKVVKYLFFASLKKFQKKK
ncbi:hypothetical protein SAMN04487989_10272 [Bizionia echini]|uniref:Uncharacterized protein n=1 Tax=Bizionia echini TaxID=649333 RepID=A0A1I5AI18_9FLAO|nr:hypothetical protein [Bizionia echini]SFN62146.1 hypothetical protein SAMN04487989_10272 [Bizionia echini]